MACPRRGMSSGERWGEIRWGLHLSPWRERHAGVQCRSAEAPQARREKPEVGENGEVLCVER
jgi:hypothetical protein